jgi:hypothetical protein
MTTDRLPSRTLPLLYFSAAHLALGLAAFLVAWSPRAAAGFFYHSRMVAIVHLVTLGWITNSILGAIYIVGPATLGISLPARRGDYVAFAAVTIGIVGMVAHFWIEELNGMAWSAATATSGILFVVARIVAGLRAAPIPGGVKLHIALAAANLAAAASAGILLGLDKVYHFLPGFVLANVFAHAHLAAVGWAAMMVVGVGYRLLSMVIPAKAPAGPTVYASAVLMEIGVLMLFTALIAQSEWASVDAILIVTGFACFAVHVAAMVRHRSKKPAGAPAVDFAVLHAAAAGISFAVACALGLYLVLAPPSDLSLRLAIAYGVFGLVGFLAQMVVGMQAKLVPLLAWYHALGDSGFKGPIVPPFAMPIRSIQEVVFTAWAFAVPAVAVGFALNAIPLLSAGGWTLLAGVGMSAAGNWAVVGAALPGFRQSSPGAPTLTASAKASARPPKLASSDGERRWKGSAYSR